MIVEEQVTWSPWHGCHKYSEGCANCFVYAMDKRYGRDTNTVHRTKTVFNVPIEKTRYGFYKHPSGTRFKTCFTSDFFIEEADEWRDEAWKIIKERSDCIFVIATKRIDRMNDHLPADWDSGYNNVIIAVSCENQAVADYRLPILVSLPIKHRWIFVSPMLEYVDTTKYLATGKIEKLLCGGEACKNARTCKGEWVEQLYLDAKKYKLPFEFHQTGSSFEYREELQHYNPRYEYQNAQKFQQYLITKYEQRKEI